MLDFIAVDLQLYKIFKITRVSFFGHSVDIVVKFLRQQDVVRSVRKWLHCRALRRAVAT